MSKSRRSLHYAVPVFRVADSSRSLEYYRGRLGFEVELNYEGFYADVLRECCRVHLKCSPPLHRDHAVFEAAEHLDACLGAQDRARRLSEL